MHWGAFLPLNSPFAVPALRTRVWTWSAVLCASAWVCAGQATAGFPPHSVSTHGPPRASQPGLFHSFQASLGPRAQIDTDVNQVISTSGFGEEVWPKGNLRAEFKGGWGREQTLSPT